MAGHVDRRAGNGVATAALVLGAAGITLVTVVPAVVLGVLGLRRAAGRGSGRVRCWAAIALAVCWAAAGAVVVPHLARAADPGCAAYKGAGLDAYRAAIADLNNGRPAADLSADGTRAVGELRAAAAQSRAPAAAGGLSALAGDLHAVLGDVRSGGTVPGSAVAALNRASARVDAACGTLRL